MVLRLLEKKIYGVGIAPLILVILLIIGSTLGAMFFIDNKELPDLSSKKYRYNTIPQEERIDDLLSHMTLKEKIGQMALVENNSISPKEVENYAIGAVLSGAGGKPKDNTPRGWREMVTSYIAASNKTRTGIPILYGVDANHGQGNVPGATIFPHFIGLGAANDEELVEAVARATAMESLAMNIRWSFSPTLDIPHDMRWGRVYEAFGSDTNLVGKLGAAYVRGLHGARDAQMPLHVLATPKHFVGAGDMLWNSSTNKSFSIDQGKTPANEVALREQYLPPFKKTIDEGALSIMVGLNMWGDEKVTASKYLLTDVLKNELSFNGFVVSDWYGVYEVSENKYAASVLAINAGVDMVMLPFEYKQFISDVERAVIKGDISQERIDDAVRRILRAKFALGLFEEASKTHPPLSVVGSVEYRTLARSAVAKSLVLLKNNNEILPVASGTPLLRVAGSAADNVGMQAGAWTIEWQGIDGNWLPHATSILAGIKQMISPQTELQYAKNGIFDDTTGNERIADIGIAIVGEKPYAEGWGDNVNPTLSAEDIAAIENLRKSVTSLVVVIVSGRPLTISDELPKWDALVAAWLPGSEGVGVVDVLFGKVAPSGKLPLPWPTSPNIRPNISVEPSSSTTLFPAGFGLQYP